jgi:hypothetical protein
VQDWYRVFGNNPDLFKSEQLPESCPGILRSGATFCSRVGIEAM